MKKIHMVWAGIAVVIAIIFTLQAQETAIPMRPVFIQAPGPSTEDDLATMIEAVELTTPMPADSVSENGTFYSAQHNQTSPEPWPPFPGDVNHLPAWNLGGDVWLLDDVTVNYDEVRAVNEAALAAQKAKLSSAGGMHAMDDSGGGFSPMMSFSTNGLWLEITNVDLTDQVADLILHNTTDTTFYQFLSKTNLLQPDWALGGIMNGTGGTNQTVLSGVSLANPMTFFNAHQANVFVYLDPGQDAVEPEGTVPGRTGIFYLTAVGATNDLTVYYRVGGTASNGVDYTYLSGVVTVPLSVVEEIDVSPIEDDVVEGVETVTLTLMPTNDYLISPDGSGTIQIYDASTTVSMGTISPQAIESNGPPGAAAQPGSFWLQRSDFRGMDTNELDVYYQVSGTASNGVDYALLDGVFHLAAGVDYTNLDVDPLTEKVITNLETVTVTLIATNSYLIDTNNQSGTVTIVDSSTTAGIVAEQNAIEPGQTTNFPGQMGYFTVSRSDTRGIYTNLTVSYSISGTASNGVDYATLSGSVTFAAGQTATNIYVQPFADYLLEGDETVTLTLLATNGCDPDPNHASDTITIQDTATFLPVVTLNEPIGIDYQAPSNSLIVSYNFNSGNPYNFARIYTNLMMSNSIVVTNVVITNWSGVHGLGDEIKVATVKTNLSGFTNGDMYFSSGTSVGWLSANGSVSNLSWGVLTNATETNALGLRGSLYVDQTGVFSNQVIAVTSDGTVLFGPKGVWRVDAQGHSTLLTNINTFHLEGVITLPNDTNRFGPWAGKIVTGDENAALIYSIATNGAVTTYATTNIYPNGGIRTEDFDIIPPNQNFYGCDPEANQIVKLPAIYFTNYVGDLLITDAGEVSAPAKLFIVHWDAATTNFVAIRIPYFHADGSSGDFEHVTFAPIDLPTQ